jgi:hypothetical protein
MHNGLLLLYLLPPLKLGFGIVEIRLAHSLFLKVGRMAIGAQI